MGGVCSSNRQTFSVTTKNFLNSNDQVKKSEEKISNEIKNELNNNKINQIQNNQSNSIKEISNHNDIINEDLIKTDKFQPANKSNNNCHTSIDKLHKALLTQNNFIKFKKNLFNVNNIKTQNFNKSDKNNCINSYSSNSKQHLFATNINYALGYCEEYSNILKKEILIYLKAAAIELFDYRFKLNINKKNNLFNNYFNYEFDKLNSDNIENNSISINMNCNIYNRIIKDNNKNFDLENESINNANYVRSNSNLIKSSKCIILNNNDNCANVLNISIDKKRFGYQINTINEISQYNLLPVLDDISIYHISQIELNNKIKVIKTLVDDKTKPYILYLINYIESDEAKANLSNSKDFSSKNKKKSQIAMLKLYKDYYTYNKNINFLYTTYYSNIIRPDEIIFVDNSPYLIYKREFVTLDKTEIETENNILLMRKGLLFLEYMHNIINAYNFDFDKWNFLIEKKKSFNSNNSNDFNDLNYLNESSDMSSNTTNNYDNEYLNSFNDNFYIHDFTNVVIVNNDKYKCSSNMHLDKLAANTIKDLSRDKTNKYVCNNNTNSVRESCSNNLEDTSNIIKNDYFNLGRIIYRSVYGFYPSKQ